MTHAERVAALISAASLLFVIMATGLGLIVRITRRWTQIEERLQSLVDRVTEAIKGSHEDYTRMEHRVDRNEDRINRHEEWHSRQPDDRESVSAPGRL